jgi:hypothetical protein
VVHGQRTPGRLAPGEKAHDGQRGHRGDRQGRPYAPSRGARRRGQARHDRPARAEARERLEVEQQVAGGLEALLRPLLQAVPHHPVEARGHRPAALDELGRLLLEDRVQRLHRARALERAPAREHLVEDRPQGEDVGAVVDGLAPHLLRRHVAHRPDHRARARPPREGGQAGGVARVDGLLALGQLGEAEVQDLDEPVARHEQVLRLQVAVHDPVLVGRGEASRDLQPVVEGAVRRQRRLAEAGPQRLALEQLRDDVVGPVLVPMSYTATMLGWLKPPAARASSSKRRRLSSSPASAEGRILTATSRPSRLSRARNTSPMPPAPREARIS